MTKPRVFIGSSGDGLAIAESLQSAMESDVESTLWSQGILGLSDGTLGKLCQALKEFDFAVLVLTPDVLVRKAEAAGNRTRDNVLFELGLFMGVLGRERTFIVHGQDPGMDLSTDLAGVTTATFSPRGDGNLPAAIGPVRALLKSAMEQAGVASPAPPAVQAAEAESVVALKEALSNQLTLTRQILEVVTSSQKTDVRPTGLSSQERDRGLDFMSGRWKDAETGSVGWARITGNEMHFVYSYSGVAEEPTGHFFNIIRIGQSLFGRFEWLDGSLSGYTYLQIVSQDLMKGGWWVSDDRPEKTLLEPNSTEGADVSQWIRQEDSPGEPAWVARYFQSLEKRQAR